MRKRTLLFVVTLVLSLLVMTGCVAQADYDAVVAERDSIQAQLTSTVAERDKARAQVTSTTAERDKARAQVNSLQNELDELKASLDGVKASLEETQTALDTAEADGEAFKSDVSSIFAELEKKTEAAAMIFGYWADSGKCVAGLMSQSELVVKATFLMTGLGSRLDVIGNAELSQLWQDAVVASTRGDEKGFLAKFAAVMDSLSDLIGNDVNAMNAKLR